MLFSGSVLFLLCVASAQAIYKDADCTFDLMEDVKYPVMFIYQRWNYILPDEKSTVGVNAHTQLFLYCPGPNNKIQLTAALGEEPTLETTCEIRNKLRISGQNYGIERVKCVTRYYSDYKNTREPCADGKGSMYEIGYEVPGKKFYMLYEVCHEYATGTTFYTKHDFRRYSKPDKLKKLDAPTFQRGPFYTDVDTVYRKQNETLENLLGKVKADKILSRHQFSRGHLTPSADFVISGSRRGTYQAVNTAPQWRSINEGNWNELEEKIRNKASKYHVDLKIITGTYGVLSIPNSEGIPKEIYLDGQKVPVPEIIWKVVYHQNQGIAFISVNTPMNPNKKELCKNICNANMWGDWSAYNKGRIYCCDVSVLKNLIPYIPITGITKILKEN